MLRTQLTAISLKCCSVQSAVGLARITSFNRSPATPDCIWSCVFLELQQMCGLKNLHLEWLEQDNNVKIHESKPIDYLDCHMSVSAKWTGREEIQRELAQLIHQATFITYHHSQMVLESLIRLVGILEPMSACALRT
jgi:hypothetical protein